MDIYGPTALFYHVSRHFMTANRATHPIGLVFDGFLVEAGDQDLVFLRRAPKCHTRHQRCEIHPTNQLLQNKKQPPWENKMCSKNPETKVGKK